MAVELRAVHAGKFGFAAHGNPAAAAHTGAVHHDGVQGHGGVGAEGLGGEGDKLHHGHGADGQHLVKLLARFQQLLQGLGHQAVAAVGAVVSHEDEAVGAGLEFLFQNHNVLAAEANDDGHFRAGFLKSPGRGQGDGAAHAAANHTDLLLALHGGGLAQRADEIPDIVALVQLAQGDGGQAHLLEDDGHGALFPVITGDGQGDALAHFIDAENDKLTGSGLFGHEGSFDFHHGDGIVQLLLGNDFEHDCISFLVVNFYKSRGFFVNISIIRGNFLFVKHK